MHAGLFLPIFDELADPRLIGEVAAEAETAGWDGVFVWDHVYYRPPVQAVTDPWTAMACIALSTTRIRFGPMVTPIARRRPHVLARQVAALDQLSQGRFVLGAGLGLDGSGRELSRFGEETDDRRRASMLDEGLGLLADLLAGDVVDHRGEHYTAVDVRFRPSPATGAVPVWVAARWPNKRPLRRSSRHDGLFLIDVSHPGELAAAVELVAANRPNGLEDFDVVVELGDDQPVDDWAAAGVTWRLAGFDPFTVTAADVRRRITRGP